MTEQRRRIDIILDEEFLEDLESEDLEELRSRRAMAGDVENELSFYRRLLHGRMDLLAFELRRRAGMENRSLIEALPEILAAGEERSQHGLRLTQDLAPDLPERGRRTIDKVLQADFLGRLPQLTEDELSSIQRTLTELEEEISAHRRAVQRAFDQLQSEIGARYRDGMVDPAIPS